MSSTADSIYPPIGTNIWWPILGVGLLVIAIAGYFLVHAIRIKLALRAQKRLASVSKPQKAAIIAKALQDIAHCKALVQTGKMAADAGAAQISLIVRTAFDTLMNHRTKYAAKYEVASRALKDMLELLELSYPTEFAMNTQQRTDFDKLCAKAEEVVRSCN